MKIAVMQPYLFPYIGYFQLINYVDKFIIYDDVNFIKGGWINRNNILLNDKSYLFTLPLKNISSFTLIKDIYIDKSKYINWHTKFLKTIYQSYKKAPYFDNTYQLINQVFLCEEERISPFIANSLGLLNNYLTITCQIVESSVVYQNSHLKSQERVIDICKQERATEYINPIGGIELYNKGDFNLNGISLRFIKTNQINYKQFTSEFVPWLSIIDIMMFNSEAEIKELLSKFELV